MGNSQFSTSKDGGDGSQEDGPYSTLYPEKTRTTPGPSGFDPHLQVGDRSAYTNPSIMGGSSSGAQDGVAGDEMDVESKTDDGEEDEVRNKE